MDIHEIAKQAQDAFWEKVAELYPTATSGDLDPVADARFDQASRDAVTAWVTHNVPGQSPADD